MWLKRVNCKQRWIYTSKRMLLGEDERQEKFTSAGIKEKRIFAEPVFISPLVNNFVFSIT